jgi:hypothetical protein
MKFDVLIVVTEDCRIWDVEVKSDSTRLHGVASQETVLCVKHFYGLLSVAFPS